MNTSKWKLNKMSQVTDSQLTEGDENVNVVHLDDTKFYVLYLETVELVSEEAKLSGMDCGIHW